MTFHWFYTQVAGQATVMAGSRPGGQFEGTEFERFIRHPVVG